MESTFKLLTSDGQFFDFKMKWLAESGMLMDFSRKESFRQAEVFRLDKIDAQALAPILEWLKLRDADDFLIYYPRIELEALFDKQTLENLDKMREASCILRIHPLIPLIDSITSLLCNGIDLQTAHFRRSTALGPILEWLQLRDDILIEQHRNELEKALFVNETREKLGKVLEASRILGIPHLVPLIDMYLFMNETSNEAAAQIRDAGEFQQKGVFKQAVAVPLENIDAQALAPILEWLKLNDIKYRWEELEKALFASKTRAAASKMRTASRILEIPHLADRIYIALGALEEFMQLMTDIVLYLVFGLVALLVNLPVIIAVFSSRYLRIQKEFVIIAGLCLTDAVNGVIFVLIGAYRWNVLDELKDGELTSRLYCLSTVPQMTSVAIDQAFAWMLLVVTVDRLFAVFFPIRYFKQNHWYAWKAILGVLHMSILFVAFAFIFTRNFTFPEVSPLCFTSDSVNPKLYRIYEITRVSTVTVSVLLYIPICLKLYFISKQRQTGVYSKKRYMRLKNMTITVALSTATSVVLVLIPDSIVAFNLFGLEKYSTYFFSVTILKSCINVVIYVIRNPLIYSKLHQCFFRSCQHSNHRSIHPTTTARDLFTLVRSEHVSTQRNSS